MDAQQFERAGRRLRKAGFTLTVALTIPLLGLAVFGWVGLAVGIVLSTVLLGSRTNRDTV